MKESIEVREMYSDIELRDITPGNNIVEGYALKFKTLSEDLGGFKETIEQIALENTNLSDVRALINHNQDLVVARTTSGTLKLWVDDVGLKFKAQIANTTYGQDLIENIRNGNISQCSFGFTLGENGDEYQFDTKEMIRKRTIKNITSIVDISFVTYPAYRDTIVAPAMVHESKRNVNYTREKEKLKLQLYLL